jgi:hypothetical protein
MSMITKLVAEDFVVSRAEPHSAFLARPIIQKIIGEELDAGRVVKLMVVDKEPITDEPRGDA